MIPAVWHVVDFEEDVDPEFPTVVRPTFSRVPPSAYRLAEPGDTLDRIMIYMSAAGVVLAAAGLLAPPRQADSGRRRWRWAGGPLVQRAPRAPPSTDGTVWAGDRSSIPHAPPDVRTLRCFWRCRDRELVARDASIRRDGEQFRGLWAAAQGQGTQVVSGSPRLYSCLPGSSRSPASSRGYWPRWAMIWGLLAFDLGLVIELAPRRPIATGPVLLRPSRSPAVAWYSLVVAAIGVTWYHRPLARLKVVEPGRIYISAMPTLRGLEIAQSRRSLSRRSSTCSPRTRLSAVRCLPDELQFAREHGIHYVGSPSDPSEAAPSAFLDQTLALARDPSAWPILVHCHGCMDRSPAWMGIYASSSRNSRLLRSCRRSSGTAAIGPRRRSSCSTTGCCRRAPAPVLGRPHGGIAAASVPKGPSTRWPARVASPGRMNSRVHD